MSPKEKSISPARPQVEENLYRVAIVGAGTLKGKELKEVLEDRHFPAIDTKLLDDDESLGKLESVGDEAAFIQRVSAQNLERVDFAFFASEESFTKRNWGVVRDAGALIVDLSYSLEGEPHSIVRAPWVEGELEGSVGLRPPADLDCRLVVIAHPAAVVLALLLVRAQRVGRVRSAICTVFEPASEHGRRGMDELHEQTVNLLSFQQMPTGVFDSQVAFNLLARYGEKSHLTLQSVERRVLSHLEKVTYGHLTQPALTLVQAPIFHSHVFSIYLELEAPVAVSDLTQALDGEHVVIARLAEDSPNNVNAAGQDDILVSVRRDARQENGFWLWAAADNLRVAAITAVDCAAALARMRSKGPIQ